MKTIANSLALTCLLGLSSFANAQEKIQPGLWEHSFDIESQSGQIEAALQQAKQMMQSLPAEQRQMIERQLAASGVNMDLDSYRARVCVTPEQAERNELPPPNDSCEQSIVERTDDGFKMEFRCDGNPPTTGEGEIHMVSDKQYRGEVTINTTMNGQAEQMVARQEGNWIAEDCGSVR